MSVSIHPDEVAGLVRLLLESSYLLPYQQRSLNHRFSLIPRIPTPNPRTLPAYDLNLTHRDSESQIRPRIEVFQRRLLVRPKKQHAK